jgi:hypothetical protein
MATQDWFILTGAERTTAMAFNPDPPDGSAEIDPRAIDAVSPGVGINLNPDATDYPDGGEVVTLVGKYVAPRRIVTQAIPAYSEGLKTFLMTLPVASLDSDTIFAPPPEI